MSYAVTLSRSSQTLAVNGRSSKNSTCRSPRSLSASEATSLVMRPLQSAASQDVRYLDRHQVGGGDVDSAKELLGPESIGPGIDESGDDGGRVDHDRHRRSASRSARIDPAVSREPVNCLRSRMRWRRTAASGRRANSMSCARRNSCNDRPEAADEPPAHHGLNLREGFRKMACNCVSSVRLQGVRICEGYEVGVGSE